MKNLRIDLFSSLRRVFFLGIYVILASALLISDLGCSRRTERHYRQSVPQDSTAKQIALSQDDIQHGEHEVSLMLKDRPAMSEVVSRGDKIWNWTVREFAGLAASERIFWNPKITDYPPEYLCWHEYPYNGKRGSIHLRSVDQRGRPVSAERLWSNVVFELMNIGSAEKFLRIYKQALAGQFTKEQFVAANSAVEFDSLKRQRMFYDKFWLPFRKERNLETHPNLWGAPDAETYDQWISNYQDKKAYPWSYWGVYFDEKIVPYRERLLIWKKTHQHEHN